VVARIHDQAILAERLEKGTSEAEKKAIEASLSLILQRAAHMAFPLWKEQRHCTGAFDGSVFALADYRTEFIVAVGIRGGLYPYPPRVAWELLKKFSEAVHQQQLQQQLTILEAKRMSLAMPLRKPMQDIMKGYGDAAEKDSITQVQEKVDGVKDMMHENVRKIIETHTTLEALQDKSAAMNDSATKFVQQSTTLKRQMQIRNLKVKAAVAISVAALGAYALLPFFTS